MPAKIAQLRNSGLAGPPEHRDDPIYVHADMSIKERAMARTAPTGAEPGRYQPASDELLTFLQSL